MFTWVCPKCGSDVPPAYSECPNCAEKAATTAGAPAAPPAETVSSPVVTPPPAAAVPVAAPAPPPPPAVAPVAPRKGSHWLSAVAATILVAAVLAGIYFIVPKARSTNAAAPAEPPAEASPAPAATAHPLANTIELTGFRLTEDRTQRVQVRFVAVNHSAAELPETKLQVSLKRDREEIMQFPFTLPSLGPYESKEITATTRTRLRTYEMPDWQFVRADFTDAPAQPRAR
jgi:hypothetical protein